MKLDSNASGPHIQEDNFLLLKKWYYSQCDGDWEHGSSILIRTIDNPGWSVYLNLEDTELEEKEFKEVNIERSSDDWIVCRWQKV